MPDEFDQFKTVKGEIVDFTNAINTTLALKLDAVKSLSHSCRDQLNELDEEETLLNEQLQDLKLRDDSLEQELRQSQSINDDIKQHMEEFNQQKQILLNQHESLQHDLKKVKEMVAYEENKCLQSRERISRQKGRKVHKVEYYERLLGLIITNGEDEEGATPGSSRVTFTFKNFDKDNLDKVCSITLEIVSAEESSQKGLDNPIQIVGSHPPLDTTSDDYIELIHTLQERDGLGSFIIKSREILTEIVQ